MALRPAFLFFNLLLRDSFLQPIAASSLDESGTVHRRQE